MDEIVEYQIFWPKCTERCSSGHTQSHIMKVIVDVDAVFYFGSVPAVLIIALVNFYSLLCEFYVT